jgi:hypothetical protein
VRTWNDTPDESAPPLNSLKERMTQAAPPEERAISTCPQGSWLDGLRTSFEPDSKGKQEPASGSSAPAFTNPLRPA